MEPDGREQQRARFEAYAKSRDPALRDELVATHIRLAEHLARRFANRGVPLDDLIQVASLGLVKAIDRFDPDRGLEFSTFATPTIVGELKRYFRDRSWAVRVPRRVQELHVELNGVVAALTQRYGRAPTVAELARATRASEEDVLEAMEAGGAYSSMSLDAPTGDAADEGRSLLSTLGTHDAGVAHAEDRMLVEELIATLAPRERLMVQLRFYDGMTQSEIAGRLGISQMHVSRLLTRSLVRLREHAAGSVSGD